MDINFIKEIYYSLLKRSLNQKYNNEEFIENCFNDLCSHLSFTVINSEEKVKNNTLLDLLLDLRDYYQYGMPSKIEDEVSFLYAIFYYNLFEEKENGSHYNKAIRYFENKFFFSSGYTMDDIIRVNVVYYIICMKKRYDLNPEDGDKRDYLHFIDFMNRNTMVPFSKYIKENNE